jgi:asperthecin polyketide synthase
MENGPHPVCSSFARSHIPNIKTYPSLRRNEDNFTTVAATLAALHALGLNICWEEYYRPYEDSYNLLHLPHYHWNNNNYFIPYLGTWTLEKAHHTKSDSSKTPLLAPSVSSLQTSSVQRVIVEAIQESTGHLTAVSDIMRPDFLDAVKGHTINGLGVVTGVSTTCSFRFSIPIQSFLSLPTYFPLLTNSFFLVHLGRYGPDRRRAPV